MLLPEDDGLLLSVLLHWHELFGVLEGRFHPGQHLVGAERWVPSLHLWLFHMPRGVTEHLDAVPLGVGEVDRYGISVADGNARLGTFVSFDLVDDVQHVLNRSGSESVVIKSALLFASSPGHQSELVMIRGASAEERNLSFWTQSTTIRQPEAKRVAIERNHYVEIVDLQDTVRPADVHAYDLCLVRGPQQLIGSPT